MTTGPLYTIKIIRYSSYSKSSDNNQGISRAYALVVQILMLKIAKHFRMLIFFRWELKLQIIATSKPFEMPKTSLYNYMESTSNSLSLMEILGRE